MFKYFQQSVQQWIYRKNMALYFQNLLQGVEMLMKALLVKQGKCNHPQATWEVRKTEPDNIFAKR